MAATSPRLVPGDVPGNVEFVGLDGGAVTLESLRGRATVLYFYPAAFTPGCTTEACDFRDNLASLSAAGYEVVGVSGDDVATLKRFSEEESLGFALLSDPGHEAARALGAWGEKVIAGETKIGALRSTFVLDADGRVLSAEYNVDPNGHVARLRESLGA
ncbi:peroxiredoxin [Leucobacter albus]|uniref:thioredoxin-dependent peroxiredoxin n=1 Tax=Leucobacter albus TaxID=272210 RepID=A0ABW3TNP7_9MICO